MGKKKNYNINEHLCILHIINTNTWICLLLKSKDVNNVNPSGSIKAIKSAESSHFLPLIVINCLHWCCVYSQMQQKSAEAKMCSDNYSTKGKHSLPEMP